jgi:hypothetical protein
VATPFGALQAFVDEGEVLCLAKAGADCDAVRRCLNDGEAPGPCTASGRVCDGTRVLDCSPVTGTMGGNATVRFDCATIGQQCVDDHSGAAACGIGACADGDVPRCQGDVLVQCVNRVLQPSDCSLFGAHCEVSTPSGVACVGDGPACGSPIDPSGALRCEGGAFVQCIGGREARTDCTRSGQSCFPGVSGLPFGCAYGAACNAFQFSSMCSGASGILSLCDDGELARFNCLTAGFANGCTESNGGQCVP